MWMFVVLKSFSGRHRRMIAVSKQVIGLCGTLEFHSVEIASAQPKESRELAGLHDPLSAFALLTFIWSRFLCVYARSVVLSLFPYSTPPHPQRPRRRPICESFILQTTNSSEKACVCVRPSVLSPCAI